MISRRILAAVALLCLVSPAMAQKTKAQLDTEITTNFPDDTTGAITPSILRTTTSDVVNSIMPAAPVVSGNLACYDGTTGLLKDCGSPPVVAKTCSVSNWFNTLSTAGVFGCSQPNFTDLLGTVATAQIAANAVTNAKLATMNAWTIKMNNTGGVAAPTDVTIDGLTVKPSPTTSDEVPIWDIAGSAMKKATLSSVVALATSGITPVKLETLTPSGASSFASSVSWAGYSSIKLVFNNVTFSTSLNLTAQLHSSSAYQATGYAGGVTYTQTNSGSAGAFGTTTANLTTGIYIVTSGLSSSAFQVGGDVELLNITGSQYKQVTGTMTANNASVAYVFWPAAAWTGAGTVDGIQFTTSTGTVSGTIEIWGIP